MLYIRADMNDVIATGHIMRCLSIADAAREMGEEALFLVADSQPVDLLRSRGYHAVELHTQWDDMESELPLLKSIIEERKANRLFIDSYQVTPRYLEELTKIVKTFYLDDLNKFIYPVSGIICYANYWEKFEYHKKYQDTQLFLGSRYTPLRSAFCHFKEKRIKPLAENLLLLSGGTDHYGILNKLLGELEKEKYKSIDVICGRYSLDYGEICQRYEKFGNVHVHRAVGNMEFYMDKADVAIAAGGTSLYELCAVGTPTISYSLADNQLDNVRQFDESQIICYAGDVRWDDVAANICRHLETYCKDPELREEKSKKMQALIDGKGARRIAEILR